MFLPPRFVLFHPYAGCRLFISFNNVCIVLFSCPFLSYSSTRDNIGLKILASRGVKFSFLIHFDESQVYFL